MKEKKNDRRRIEGGGTVRMQNRNRDLPQRNEERGKYNLKK